MAKRADLARAADESRRERPVPTRTEHYRWVHVDGRLMVEIQTTTIRRSYVSIHELSSEAPLRLLLASLVAKVNASSDINP